MSPSSPPPFKTILFLKKSTSLTVIGIWNLGKAQQRQEPCCPLILVYAAFLCVQTRVWLPVLWISMWAQIRWCLQLHTSIVWTPEEILRWRLTGRKKRPMLHQGLEPTSVLRLAFPTRGSNRRRSCAWLFTPRARTHVSLAPGFSHQELEPTSVLRLTFHTRSSNPRQSCGCSVRHLTK